MEEMVKERGVSSSAQLVCQLLDMFSKLCRGSYRRGGGVSGTVHEPKKLRITDV